MNIRRPARMLALLLSLTAILGGLVPGTLAHMTSQSNTLVNTFSATYIPPQDTSAEVRVVKTVTNAGAEHIGPQGFRFELENAQTGERLILTTDADGMASAQLPFTAADKGAVHTYRLSEIDDGREGVAYSDLVYEIVFSLSVSADNRLVAAASVNGKPVDEVVAEFENVYTAGVALPDTGDGSSLAACAAALAVSCTGLFLLLRRRNPHAQCADPANRRL